MTRSIHVLFVFLALFMVSLSPSSAQEAGAVLTQESQNADPRAATGGAQTLEDIMARQNGETIEPRTMPSTDGNADGVEGSSGQLAPLGSQSDADVFRAFRDGSADIISSDSSRTGAVVMQNGGMFWLNFRAGPLRTYGGYLLIGVLAVLALFFLIRGRIRIEGELTGKLIPRMAFIERFSHWLMAGSFLILGFTGLMSLFGRVFLIPTFGHQSFSMIARISKLVHNYISWAFMLGLIMVFVLWVVDNFPKKIDFQWLKQAGGLFTTGVHPPAGKFNAGEKMIFWIVIVLGVMMSATGLSLVFPFQISMFAPTFEILNNLGLPQLIGLGELNSNLALQEEMQFTQLWHAIVGFIYMAIIFAHIYIGSIGMEGAYDAITKGKVDERWAKQHHDVWYKELQEKEAAAETEKEPAE